VFNQERQMAKKEFSVPEVPGSKRGSAHRDYTHAVIGRHSGALEAANLIADEKANGAKYSRWDEKSWNDWKRCGDAVVGQLYRNHNNAMVVANDWQVELARDFIAKHPSLDTYLAHKKAERQGYIDKAKARGDGELGVLQWSMSHANAMKAAGSFAKRYVDVRVVPCVPIEKRAKKAAAKPDTSDFARELGKRIGLRG
jgi:uncharacterized lipoprotein YddW (UPF0748 family)